VKAPSPSPPSVPVHRDACAGRLTITRSAAARKRRPLAVFVNAGLARCPVEPMAKAIGPPSSNTPGAELSRRGIQDDHRVSGNGTAEVTGPGHRVRRHMRVKRTDDATPENPRGPFDVLPVRGVYPEAAPAPAFVPRLDKSHEAAVVDEESADFAKVLRQPARPSRDRANILLLENHQRQPARFRTGFRCATDARPKRGRQRYRRIRRAGSSRTY